ncbi:MAG: chemotaxis-specific protein-glutamate methyltransferase CheB [Flavobacteriales bacterium]|nr:chemotaxis-specific protein-glutamate methyltransferase CheB [Flavobacteriales bacterium]
MIKVIVVDDSSVMRFLISDILEEDADIQVLSTAVNGKEAYERTMELRPDVVVMDIHMGRYDGVFAVREIMRQMPVPILLLTAVGNVDMGLIEEALSEGAFDYLNKPIEGNARLRSIGEELISKVKAAAKVDANKLSMKRKAVNTNIHSFGDKVLYDIIVIGASTGGPTAVGKVLSNLPCNLTIPVIIVQHMPENFMPSFVKRLNGLSPLSIKLGKLGHKLTGQEVVVAPGGVNMKLLIDQEGHPSIGFTKKKFKVYNNPSIDCLMESVADHFKEKTLGVILTGMGKDGTAGLAKIKKYGGRTVVQDKDTSVVFGMPGEAIRNGVADHVVPIHEMGNFLVSCLA